jgi:hypothetical protein
LYNRPDIAPHGQLTGEYWHRPGELLVHEEDVGRIEDEFGGFEIAELTPRLATERAERASERTRIAPAPVDRAFEAAARRRFVRMATSARMHVPALVAHFRERPAARPEGRDVRVAPHLVLMGEQAYRGSPADEPVPADGSGFQAGDGRAGSGVTVAVLDTGLAAHRALDGRCLARPEDSEVVDEDGDGRRDHQAGHGTFVAGRVLARAPGATVVARRVLDSWGITDELTVAGCLDELGDVDVVNLSLGGYSHENTEPLALAAALASLPERTVVVAAAGNYGKARPFWPAALKRCIAVAAVDADGSPAGYTNYGSWVDACAPGSSVESTFLEHTDAADGHEPGESFQGWARWSGTSFATPHVAAAIAERVRGGTDPRAAAFQLLRDCHAHERAGHGVVVA